MIDVHATGGPAMMRAARQAVNQTAAEMGRTAPLLIAVTVLTSLAAEDLLAIGMTGSVDEQVLRLARLAQENGLDGVVCSAHEAAALRAVCGGKFKLVTPGIRPAGAALNDQARVMTPEAAIAAGADYLVIGRPITGAADPLAALDAINASIGAETKVPA
jgi:orotidine-5'-phosphate decarboxylase